MRTKKCAELIAGCLSLLVVGIFFMEWEYFVLIIPFLLFLLLGIVLFFDPKIDIEITREVSKSRIFEENSIVITLHIKNRGSSLRFLELYDELPGRVKLLQNSNYMLLSIKSNEEITVSYEISCPLRGYYQIGPVHVRVRDFLGLLYKEQEIDNSDYITVIPRFEELGQISIGGKVNPYPGNIRTKRTGTGTEFYGIREYAAGDSFKRINWKSFARWSQPMVNEYELESTTDVILILDTRENQQHGIVNKNPLEYGIKAAVSLASHFLKQRDRVGLIIYGNTEGKLLWIYPDSGKNQLYKLIRKLVEVQPQGEFSFNGVVHTSKAHLLPKKSLVILISSLENDPSLLKGIETLIARNHHIIILSPSPIHIQHSLITSDISSEIALKILCFERKIYLSRFRNLGVRVVDWDPLVPLAVSLKEVERYRIKR